jgi:deoxyribonuclease V
MSWTGTIAEARRAQERMRSNVRIVPLEIEPAFIAGVDAAFSENRVFAAACLYTYPDLICIERTQAAGKLTFPYVPGYLSFREGPAIIKAIGRLKRHPDVILVDGQGIAHPRRIGIASHLGVVLDIPTIGCAKTRLLGAYQEPALQKGNWSALHHAGEIVGAVLRTREGVSPLFISPGHRIDLGGSVRLALACSRRYRIPEPLRCADEASRRSRGLAMNRAERVMLHG